MRNFPVTNSVSQLFQCHMNAQLHKLAMTCSFQSGGDFESLHLELQRLLFTVL